MRTVTAGLIELLLAQGEPDRDRGHEDQEDHEDPESPLSTATYRRMGFRGVPAASQLLSDVGRDALRWTRDAEAPPRSRIESGN